ncbi:hypothetical protein [Paenibacillus spongiae]|uniref:Phosphodiester glycosidase domain-containing protein n=1 Tax=Paenibacillus spongiae TaxID=2909671 RepID=A0ABY5SKD3_9BACL|nr:hypothetical protein [Paenibacillus spongiae]UVI32698.1 hypothetical protein L1F29_13100 [Paenibacillus spongiae]
MSSPVVIHKRNVIIAVAIALFVLGMVAMLLVRLPGEGPVGPTGYGYQSYEADNGVKLHVILTKPSNVTLTAIADNVTETAHFGINGGFFYEGALLSIAVVNDVPVKGGLNDYGSGGQNAKYARGTLVWDEATGNLSVQVVQRTEQIIVADRSRFWAQGGVSMLPGNQTAWERQAAAEMLPAADEKRLRTGAVFDETQSLYLIVSETKATADEFRSAILEMGGKDKWVDGIFLDGDGSSQMRCAEAILPGDRREVFQMIRLLE